MSFHGGKPQFPPTDEQQAAVDAFLTGEDMAISALAGSGKTSTLQFLAHSKPNAQMTYCAFNKSISTEAQRRFPSNTISRTVHSFAFRAVGKDYSDRLNGPRVPSWKVADILRIPARWDFGATYLRDKQLARLVMEAVSRFCHSADSEPSMLHVPRVPGLDDPVAHAALCELLFPFVQDAWEDLTRYKGQLRYNHDCYLKLWSMGSPLLPGSVVLVDEVQDLDPVIAYIISQQDAQKVYVGDKFQTIYSWRGTTDLLSDPELVKRWLTLCKTFRFGPAIAEEANRILTLLRSELLVVGHEPVPSQLALLGRPDVVLCRTNAGAVGRLMEAQVAGLRTALVGGTAQVEALARAAQQLAEGQRTDHPELMAFENWAQVRDYVEGDVEGRELKVLVELVDTHGAGVLLEAVQQAVPEPEAQFVVSTAHRAKGREWDRVKLDADFPVPIQVDPETGERRLRAEEARLAYVAVTRAKLALDSQSLEWVGKLADQLGQERVFSEVEEPEREVCSVRALPTEQLICDPERSDRLMFRRTRYDPALVAAQRELPGRRYLAVYCAEEKVNVVDATPSAIELAERFGLTISEDARSRVQGSRPGTAPAAAGSVTPGASAREQ